MHLHWEHHPDVFLILPALGLADFENGEWCLQCGWLFWTGAVSW